MVLRSRKLLSFLLLSMCCFPLFSETYHRKVSDSGGTEYLWEREGVSPFDELIISWNALRPARGYYAIAVCVGKEGRYSSWTPYAEWGVDSQRGFVVDSEEVSDDPFGVRVRMDSVQPAGKEKGTGFRIRVTARKGADLRGFKSLTVFADSEVARKERVAALPRYDERYLLDVKGISQMALPDERRARLCSPASTTALVRFLRGDDALHPVVFAESVRDVAFDIFGNWVLNVAEAYQRLADPAYSCWVARCTFRDLLDLLKGGMPVVISVRGPLPGSAQPYEEGHLLVVIGFDGSTGEVICMDPAFATDTETRVRYKVSDLMEAWARRGHVGYVFRHSGFARSRESRGLKRA
ncbi:MAG: C39 family peptidase [Simkaniaceae bacterium]|nr:C39 family peptidase [Simkaniaceae bacterium]